MYKSPYQIVREEVAATVGKDVNELHGELLDPSSSFSWKRLLDLLNDKMRGNINSIIKSGLRKREVSLTFISEEFQTAVLNNNQDSFMKVDACELTKIEPLKRLFRHLNDNWAKDFDPKTKDFFAVLIAFNGWADLLTLEKPVEKEDANDVVKHIHSLRTAFLDISRTASNLNLTLDDILKFHGLSAEGAGEVMYVRERLEKYIPDDLFEKQIETISEEIIASDELSPKLKLIIETFLSHNKDFNWDSYYKSIIVTSLGLSLGKKFSAEKIHYLVRFINDEPVWGDVEIIGRAISGFTIGFLKAYKSKDALQRIKEKFKLIMHRDDVLTAFGYILSSIEEDKSVYVLMSLFKIDVDVRNMLIRPFYSIRDILYITFLEFHTEDHFVKILDRPTSVLSTSCKLYFLSFFTESECPKHVMGLKGNNIYINEKFKNLPSKKQIYISTTSWIFFDLYLYLVSKQQLDSFEADSEIVSRNVDLLTVGFGYLIDSYFPSIINCIEEDDLDGAIVYLNKVEHLKMDELNKLWYFLQKIIDENRFDLMPAICKNLVRLDGNKANHVFYDSLVLLYQDEFEKALSLLHKVNSKCHFYALAIDYISLIYKHLGDSHRSSEYANLFKKLTK